MSSPLKLRYKILMFLSSYTPLFLILFLKSVSNTLDKVPDFVNTTIPGKIVYNMTTYDKFQFINHHKIAFFYYDPILTIVLIITILSIVISNFVLWRIITDTKNTNNPMDLYIDSFQKLDNVYINYFLCYVIPFLSFNYSNIFDMISLFILLSTTCAIYINSDLLYVNVFFSVRGYNIFRVVNEEHNEYVVLSKKKQLYLRRVIKVRDVSASSERFVLDIE